MEKITICMGPSCTRNFSKDIVDTAKEKLNCEVGETSSSGVELQIRKCFTNCEHGPSVALDNKILCQVTPKEMAFLIKTIKKKDFETLDSMLSDAEEI